ncbi:MAG: hypothetical protein WAW52_12595 [Methanothrix sp.]
MEILLTNAGKEPIEIEADSWSLKEYQDAHRAADFSIQCSRTIPVGRYAQVVATENRRVLFRGYVKSPKIKNIKTRELTCKGEEDLLLRRTTGRFAYQASTRNLIHVFQSDAPNQVADAYGVTGNVGLLFIANSKISHHGNTSLTDAPTPDWYWTGVDWAYGLYGLGLDSRIGLADIYAEGTLLPRVDSYAELQATAVSCFSDASHLYIRLDDDSLNAGFGPRYMMLAENCYDTGIRMGNVDLPDTVLTGNLQLNFDRIMDVLIDLAEFYGLNPRYRRARDCTYMDFLDEPTETEFTLQEENIEEITQSYSEDPLVHALTGLGIGSRDVQQIYTPSTHSWKGIWIEDTIDVDEGFFDAVGNLKPYVDAEFAIRQADEMFTISPTPDWGHKPKPNDMIRLRLFGEAEKLLQVASAKTDSKGNYEMEIGGRKSDLVDAFNAKDSLNRVYFDEYLVEFGKAITTSGTAHQMGDTTHGECSGATASVTIPAEVYEADGTHRVTLDISITSDEKPVSCIAYIQINGLGNILSIPRHYLLNDQISGLDITSRCNYGAATTIAIWVKKNGEWDGATCADHPTMDISATVRMWKRTILGSSIKRPISKQKIKYAKWDKMQKFVIKYAK